MIVGSTTSVTRTPRVLKRPSFKVLTIRVEMYSNVELTSNVSNDLNDTGLATRPLFKRNQ